MRSFALLIGMVLMTYCLVRRSERQHADCIVDETNVRMVVSIALALFIELGPNRLSRLLDAIADNKTR